MPRLFRARLLTTVERLAVERLAVEGLVYLYLAVSHRLRQKACDRCHQFSQTLYRIQHDDSRKWAFVCLDCLPILSCNNAFYVYGGTWKAQKKS